MNGKSYNIEFFQALAKDKGGECLSNEYVKLKNKLEWKCANNHIFKLAPQKILDRDYWCHICTNRRVLQTVEDMKKLANDRGWVFLSDKYLGDGVKHKWICKNGHEIFVRPNHVKKNVGCRICAGKGLLSINEFKKIAEEKGGKCLSEVYKKGIKLKFVCSNNHEFETSADSIKYANSWCPKCAGLELGTIEEMKKLAESRGGKCLSDEYIKSATKLEWQCKDGHKWFATPRDVKSNDSWCPYCTWYKQETKCKFILEKLLNTEFVKQEAFLKADLS